MATQSGRTSAVSGGPVAVLKYACIPALLALAACNSPPPPAAAAPQVIERTRVVEQQPVVQPVVQPSLTVDINAHNDDDRRRREEEARRHDDHPH